jgi:hypothetical protein
MDNANSVFRRAAEADWFDVVSSQWILRSSGLSAECANPDEWNRSILSARVVAATGILITSAVADLLAGRAARTRTGRLTAGLAGHRRSGHSLPSHLKEDRKDATELQEAKFVFKRAS